MSSVVRQIDAFYEATGPYAVDRPIAESLYKTTLGFVGNYVGRIIINGPRGVRIPLSDELIHPRRINLGTAPHTMLLTRRPIDVSGSSEDGAITDGVCDLIFDGSLVRQSKTIVQVQPPDKDPTSGASIISGVHEVGHSFGLDHCQDEGCVMYPTTTIIREHQLYGVLSSGSPFRGSCAEDLELGAYLALADNLA